MGTKQEQRKIAFQTKWFDEIKAYSDYSGVPMATFMTRLWINSSERKRFMKWSEKNGTESIERHYGRKGKDGVSRTATQTA